MQKFLSLSFCCLQNHSLSRRTFFKASFFLSFFLSLFRCLDDDDDDDDDDAPPVRLFLLEARRRKKKHGGKEEEETTKKGASLPKVRTKHSAFLRGRDDKKKTRGVCTPTTL